MPTANLTSERQSRLLPASALNEAATIWQSLQEAIDPDALTCGWDWTSSWIDTYGDLVPHWFLVGLHDEEPYAIALLTKGVGQKRGPLPIRTAHVGPAGEPTADRVFIEHNRLLVRPDDRATFAAVIVETLNSGIFGWDELMFDGFEEADAGSFDAVIPGLFVRREPCPTTDLDLIRRGGGDVVAALGKNTRYNVRRSIRELGELESIWAESVAEAHAMLADLVALHQARWTAAGETGAFASERFLAMHRRLIERLLPRGQAYLFRVRQRATGNVIGCLYGFIEHGKVYFYQSGFAQDLDDKIKPGLTTHALCMQACLDRGLQEYDFLQGDSRYKRELSNTERHLVWAVASKPGLRKLVLGYARRRHYRNGSAVIVQ